jgi:formylglycine-generating enzyme required for sulfatase activity
MGLFSNNKFKDPFAKDMVKVCAGLYTIDTWAVVLDYPGGDKRRKKELTKKCIGKRKMTITKEYQICKYVVTQKQWKLVMGEGFNPSRVKGDDLPVNDVSYDDIMKFIKKLNTLTVKKYRLPSEAEWEWAARGASKDKDEGWFAGCYSENDLGKYAWFYENSKMNIHPVGKKRSNELGLYDMTGNVYEFCQDMYSEEVVGGEDYIAKKGERHVLKGGDCRTPLRDEEKLYIGFRREVLGVFCETGFRLAHDVDN